jgi:hypothetical protein
MLRGIAAGGGAASNQTCAAGFIDRPYDDAMTRFVLAASTFRSSNPLAYQSVRRSLCSQEYLKKSARDTARQTSDGYVEWILHDFSETYCTGG